MHYFYYEGLFFLLKLNMQILLELLLSLKQPAIQEMASLEGHMGFVLVFSLLEELDLSEQ